MAACFTKLLLFSIPALPVFKIRVPHIYNCCKLTRKFCGQLNMAWGVHINDPMWIVRVDVLF